jgi:hypothetical protein
MRINGGDFLLRREILIGSGRAGSWCKEPFQRLAASCKLLSYDAYDGF